MSDIVVTVTVSAGVSGFVALGIEYVAKPRLEARKEELLELHRRRRGLKAMLLKITTLSAMWVPYVGNGASELDGEMARALEQLGEMTRQLFDDVEWYAGTFSSLMVKGRPSVRDLVIRYIIAARAVYLSEMPQADMLQIMREISEPLQVGLAGRWPLTRTKALVRFPKALDTFVPPDSATPDSAAAEAGKEAGELG